MKPADDPLRLEPDHLLVLAMIVIGLTASVQAIVLLSNSSFVLRALGVSTLIIYLAAAICYMLMPWIEAHLDEYTAHLRGTRWALLAFCFWIGSEETAHASHSYDTPEVVSALAGLFVHNSDVAVHIGRIITVVATLLMIELLAHLQIHGVVLFRHAQKAKRRHHVDH
jgi:hypothetical protein